MNWKNTSVKTLSIDSVKAMNTAMGITAESNPLINVIDLHGVHCLIHDPNEPVVIELYSIWFKKGTHGKLRYGQGAINFSTGTMFFMAPGQLILPHGSGHSDGWGLYFHSDLLGGRPLSRTIREYDFFSYANTDALGLTADEEVSLNLILTVLKKEIAQVQDQFSQDVILSHLNALLHHADRFYHRQLQKEKTNKPGLLERVEAVLKQYFDAELPRVEGLPTVSFLSKELCTSPNHLNEQLKALTGKSAYEHVSACLADKAKLLLLTTSHSASEIGFLLGYQHSQSFSKLFRKTVGCSPIEYRKRFMYQ